MSENIDKIKISVITVCYNAEKFINNAIVSVLMQKYPNLEYIVIDGGSIDTTLEILKKYKNNIDYFVSEKDRGIYHAMNKGAAVSSGEFLFFLNSDDVFCDDNVLSDIADVIHGDTSVDLVYGNVLMERDGEVFQQRQVPSLNREMLCRWGFCHQALFVRRSFFLSTGGFSEEFKVVADVDWLARSLALGAKSRYVDRDIAIFSLDGLSGTTNWIKEKRRYLKKNYSLIELFRWRTLPGLFGRKKKW